MRISLRAGEKFYLNGAVIAADRKVSLELLNDAAFLLETHVIQVDEANTPLRQLYFAIQIALMEPASAASRSVQILQMFEAVDDCVRGENLAEGIAKAKRSYLCNRYFEALKTLRGLFAEENEILGASKDIPQPLRRSA